MMMERLIDIEQKQAEEHWLKKGQQVVNASLFGQDRGISDQQTNACHSEIAPEVQRLLTELGKGKPFNVFKLGLAALVITLRGYHRDFGLIGLPSVTFGGETSRGKVFISTSMHGATTARDLLRMLHAQLIEGLESGNYDWEAFRQRCERVLESGSQAFEQISFLMPNEAHPQPDHRQALLEVVLWPDRVSFRGGKSSYPQAFLEVLAENFHWVLKSLLSNLDSELTSITPPRPVERERILQTFNDNDVDFPEMTILEAFEQAAHRFPKRMAVICSGRSLDYETLDGKASALAAGICKEAGHKKLGRVAVLVERTENFPVAVLAVLKAGAAYVPIDPSLPEARIVDCLTIADCDLCVTRIKTFGSMLTDVGIPLVDVEHASETSDVPATSQSAADPAYLILTSGSTGKPKAVSVSHRSLINHIHWFVQEFDLTEGDSSYLMTSVGFDGTLTTFWSTLTTGGALHIYPEKVFDPETIARCIAEQKITFLKVVPTAFRAVLQSDYFQRGGDFSSLRFVKMGGETFDPQCATLLWQRFPLVQLANHYGLTETGIGTSMRKVTPGLLEGFKRRLDIGFPYHNNKAYVVNEQDDLLPIGAAGHLIIAGPSLADEYVGNPDLNKQRFFTHPTFGRCFRTHDAARWLADGSLEFLGRTDRQVKVNGNRIELAEIEAQILSLPKVQNARVEVRTVAGNEALVGYWVGTEGANQRVIQEHLRKHLPTYMIPPYFVQLTTFPVNANGKLDGKALPTPELEAHGMEGDEETGAIGALKNAWEKVLQVRPIHSDQDYFSLGGDSIKAIRVVAEMRQRGYRIQVKDLFDHPTIRQLAEKAVRSVSMALQGPVEGPTELSPIQQNFFDQRLVDPHHWNQSVMLFSSDPLEASKLDTALALVVEHHDALRMVFTHKNGHIVQVNRPVSTPATFLLEEVDLLDVEKVEAAINAKANALQATLDPSAGPMVAGCIYHTHAGDHVQLIVHHLVMDAVSFRIFLEDLFQMYGQLLSDAEPRLPQKSTSFQAWTSALSQLQPSGVWKADLDYWNQLPEPGNALFFEHELNGLTLRDQAHSALRFSFLPEQTHQFLGPANNAYGTRPFELALSAWVLAWSRWTENKQVFLRMESHGRHAWNDHMDVSRTVGWFTCEFPMLLSCSTDDIRSVVKAVKEQLRHVPNQGLGFGVWKHQQRGSGPVFEVKPEVSFNYLGDLNLSMEEGGLEPSPFSPGHNTSPRNHRFHHLELNMWTNGGRLWMEISHQLPASWNERLKKLQTLYEEALAEVVEHTLGREQNEKTASDFSHAELEQTDLDQIFEQLEKD